MKITMGVDNSERATKVADMIEALEFNMPQVDVVHVTESMSCRSKNCYIIYTECFSGKTTL